MCPNHSCALEGLDFPLKPKGTGICPVSGASFDYEIDLEDDATAVTLDKFGNKMKSTKFKVKGDEN